MPDPKRLTHLKQIRDDKYAVLRGRLDAVQEIHARLMTEKVKFENLQSKSDHQVRGLAKAEYEKDAAKQQKKVDVVVVEHAEAVRLRGLAEDDWNAASRLFIAAEEYALANGIVEHKPGAVGLGRIDISAESLATAIMQGGTQQ